MKLATLLAVSASVVIRPAGAYVLDNSCKGVAGTKKTITDGINGAFKLAQVAVTALVTDNANGDIANLYSLLFGNQQTGVPIDITSPEYKRILATFQSVLTFQTENSNKNNVNDVVRIHARSDTIRKIM